MTIEWRQEIVDCKMHCVRCGAKLEGFYSPSGRLPIIVLTPMSHKTETIAACRNCGANVGQILYTQEESYEQDHTYGAPYKRP